MMRDRLDSSNAKKAYYFGVMALISFLTQTVLKWTQRTSRTELPPFLIVLTIFLTLLLAIVCIWHCIKSLKEPTSPKKIVGIILAMLSFGFVCMLVFNVF